MSHYLDDEKATAETFTADGWLRTGDQGVIDESGCLRIVGRSKDMFIVGGFNAYPAEIENLLLRHPDIAQVAVIGIPDERMGEVGMAFVVPRVGHLAERRRGRGAGPAPRWPTTRRPASSRSSTSCRSTPPARSRRTCSAPVPLEARRLTTTARAAVPTIGSLRPMTSLSALLKTFEFESLGDGHYRGVNATGGRVWSSAGSSSPSRSCWPGGITRASW